MKQQPDAPHRRRVDPPVEAITVHDGESPAPAKAPAKAPASETVAEGMKPARGKKGEA